MALPKRKTSKARSAKRRTHYKIAKPGLSTCPNCGELKLPHRICSYCSFYKGRTFKKEAAE